MERIEVVATSHFTDSIIGGVSRKQRLFLDPNTADRLEALGLVRPANPLKAAASTPQSTEPQVAGGGESSASSQAAQASLPPTAIASENSAGPESSSTTPGDSPEIPKFSTLAMASGGNETTRLSLKGSAGRKTK
jgi:hypothetical protein